MTTRRPRFLPRPKIRDPLAGLDDAMRDTLEAGAKAALAFWDNGEVRSMTHPDRVVCKAAVMRVLIGLKLFAPAEDSDCVRITREGERLARMSIARRESFASLRQREAARLVEGRAFIERMAERRRREAEQARFSTERTLQ